ncbi:MAG: Hpt domain-containing protein [Candidatus Eisenbacteria bacterium]|nr:Hpt domain-containing protein [Candidatus Eisenbacteria bacterium]
MNIEDVLGDEYREMQEEYLVQIRSSLDQMKHDLDGGDLISIRRTSHSLKGSAGMFGYDRVGELGSQIEQAALAEDVIHIEPLLIELEETYQEIRQRAA